VKAEERSQAVDLQGVERKCIMHRSLIEYETEVAYQCFNQMTLFTVSIATVSAELN